MSASVLISITWSARNHVFTIHAYRYVSATCSPANLAWGLSQNFNECYGEERAKDLQMWWFNQLQNHMPIYMYIYSYSFKVILTQPDDSFCFLVWCIILAVLLIKEKKKREGWASDRSDTQFWGTHRCQRKQCQKRQGSENHFWIPRLWQCFLTIYVVQGLRSSSILLAHSF